MALDFDSLQAPIAGDAPCGPDLRAEPDFRDIEDAPGEFASMAAGDLRKTVARCAEFLSRTKDQMPAIVATQAAARAGDFDDANTALRLIKDFAENYWEDFHPGPVEELAIGRVNELSALSRPAALILPLQRTALARMPLPSTAEFTSAMMTMALAPVLEWTSEDDDKLAAKLENGTLTAANGRAMRATHDGGRMLRMVMRTISPAAHAADRAAGAGEADDIDPAQAKTIAINIRGTVEARAAAFKTMSDTLYDIMEVYERHSTESPSFGPVIAQIKTINETCEKFLEAFPDPATLAVEEMVGGGDVVDAGPGGGGPASSGPSRGFSGDTPRNRDEVIVAIEAICRFYAQAEPSSPVPLMLRRVQAWVNKDFMELIREIVPSGADEVSRLLALAEE